MGYYLAMPPPSKIIKGALVVVCRYKNPESILSETRLGFVAAAQDLVAAYVSMGNQVLPDAGAIKRISAVLKHITSSYAVDPSLVAIGGYDLAGTIILRYAELAEEHPELFAVHPKVIFGIASPVDLGAYYYLSERQIKKNFYPPTVNDAKFLIDLMNKSDGSPNEHPENYRRISPFDHSDTAAGNEQFLKHVSLRLYYDTDIEWQLKTRHNGYYDTYFPDASELVNRLQIGHGKAEFVVAKQPGMRSNGQRNAGSYSIVDETDCIQWIKKELHIFDQSNPSAYFAPYSYGVPEGWGLERSVYPPAFAPTVPLSGIEEIRFPPGWGIYGQADYWSVAYLLWLDTEQKIDAGLLRENLKIYFDGLVQTGGGPVPHHIPAGKLLPTVVHIQKIKGDADDVVTYSGTIDMLDYMAMKPIRLNYLIHVKDCSAQKHIPVFIEASPKPYEDVIWHEMRKLKINFKCGE